MKKCDLCSKKFEGCGNNPNPLKGKICCDQCNEEKVIPARFKMLKKEFDSREVNHAKNR